MSNSSDANLVDMPIVTTDSLSFKEQEWKSEHEKILIEWADKAMCYRWLHARSHQSYSKTNTWFTIPVIIMSTLTGTANFAQDKISEEYRPYAQMGIGAVNIFAGILTTIAQFLKISELNEAHRASSISWDKFYRNIKVELAKSRDERIPVNHMLKMCKEEFDRLMEISPSIGDKIIGQFNYTFPAKKSLEKTDHDFNTIKSDIIRPEICDELVSTADIVFIPKETDKSNVPSSADIARQKNKIIEGYEREVLLWSSKFEEKHNRKPLESELLDNLQDKMNPEILTRIVAKIMTSANSHRNSSDALNNV
tara:strand:+ start:454 stop:1380 length:927 start_codon:yes stop_codon:yes gene_type:complete